MVKNSLRSKTQGFRDAYVYDNFHTNGPIIKMMWRLGCFLIQTPDISWTCCQERWIGKYVACWEKKSWGKGVGEEYGVCQP